jgi:hypothetical protein
VRTGGELAIGGTAGVLPQPPEITGEPQQYVGARPERPLPTRHRATSGVFRTSLIVHIPLFRVQRRTLNNRGALNLLSAGRSTAMTAYCVTDSN